MPQDLPLISGIIDFFNTVDVSISSWDFLIWTFFGFASVVYAILFVSRGRIVPILLSTYIAFFLVEFNPFLTLQLGQRFGLDEAHEVRLAAFALAFLVSLLVLWRVVLQSPVGAETFGMIAAFLLAVSQVGFLIAVVISFLPPNIIRNFSELSFEVFLGGNKFFYWTAAPVVFLLLFGRKANREVGY